MIIGDSIANQLIRKKERKKETRVRMNEENWKFSRREEEEDDDD